MGANRAVQDSIIESTAPAEIPRYKVNFELYLRARVVDFRVRVRVRSENVLDDSYNDDYVRVRTRVHSTHTTV